MALDILMASPVVQIFLTVYGTLLSTKSQLDAVQGQNCIVDEVAVSAAWANVLKYQQNAAS